MIAHEEGQQAALHVGPGNGGTGGQDQNSWKQAGRMRAQRGRW